MALLCCLFRNFCGSFISVSVEHIVIKFHIQLHLDLTRTDLVLLFITEHVAIYPMDGILTNLFYNTNMKNNVDPILSFIA